MRLETTPTTKLKSVPALKFILMLLMSVATLTTAWARQDVQPLDPKAVEEGGIFRWMSPVRVSLAGEASQELRDFVNQKAELFRKLTKHDIEAVEGSEGNMVLLFMAALPSDTLSRHAAALTPLYADDAAMLSDLQDDVDQDLCIAKRGVSPENRYEVVYAVGLVPAGLDDKDVEACIERLFSSTLAFSIDKGRPLVKDAKAKSNTGMVNFLQAVTLKAIYDDRVKPGMSAAQAQPIITEVTLKAMKNLN
jgi:hypothetical protein